MTGCAAEQGHGRGRIKQYLFPHPVKAPLIHKLFTGKYRILNHVVFCSASAFHSQEIRKIQVQKFLATRGRRDAAAQEDGERTDKNH